MKYPEYGGRCGGFRGGGGVSWWGIERSPVRMKCSHRGGDGHDNESAWGMGVRRANVRIRSPRRQ